MNKTAQFMQKLEQAGCTEQMINQVVNSKDNELAIRITQFLCGHYELVKKELFQTGQVVTLRAFNGPTSLLFSTDKTGKDKQLHTDGFSQLISEVSHIDVSELKVQTLTLTESMNRNEICEAVGSEHKLAFKSKAEALRVLGDTITDKYRDRKATIVYYFEAGVLYRTGCYWGWNSEDNWWYCDACCADKYNLIAGNRVRYPVTES